MSRKTIPINKKKDAAAGGNGNPEPLEENTEPVETEGVVDEPSPEQDPESSEFAEAVEEMTDSQRADEMTDQLQRLAAEFENYKKKNAKEFERGHRAGGAYIIEKLFPVFDSFDLALLTPNLDDSTGLFEGLKKIREQMIELLDGAGLKIIAPLKGEAFNPHFHEVLVCLETEEIDDNTVFATLQPGYSYKGYQLRAAKVQLAIAPKTKDEESE